jgi:hypothetical protein
VGDITFGTVGEDEYLRGFAYLPDVPVYWQSDVPWIITVRSLDPDLGASHDGTYVKPLSDLMFRPSGEKNWRRMRQDAEEIASGTETGEGTIYADFRVILKFQNDVPGRYRTTLIFTIEEL